MKKISYKQIKKELAELNVDESTVQLVMNDISLYNDIIDNYKTDNTKNIYLLYQVNLQIFKMLQELKKGKPVKEESDAFTTLVANLKSNKKPIEKR